MNAPQPILHRRVLLIDDNPAIHEDFRKILGGDPDGAGMDEAEAAFFGDEQNHPGCQDFEIDSAMQGQEGLERVKQALKEGRPYAMAFIDVRMPPGWDGVETISKIWEIYPDLQVVLCTAYSDYSWDKMIAKVGQSDRLVILKKPFDNVEVLQLANALIAKWHLLQQTRSHIRDLEARVGRRTKEIESDRAMFQSAVDEISTTMQNIGDNTRFLQDAFKDLKEVIGAAERLAASGPKQLSEWRAKVTAAGLADRTQNISKAIQQSLDGVAQVTEIVRGMKEFSQPPPAEKTPVALQARP